MWPIYLVLVFVGLTLAWVYGPFQTHSETLVQENNIVLSQSLARFHQRALSYIDGHPNSLGTVVPDNVSDIPRAIAWKVLVTSSPRALISYTDQPVEALGNSRALQIATHGDIGAGIVHEGKVNGVPLPADANLPDGTPVIITYLEGDDSP